MYLKKIIFVFSIFFFLTGCQNLDHTKIEEDNFDLILYSGHSESLTNFYVKEFQEKTGLMVKIIMGGGSEVIDLYEKNKDYEPADVIIGVGSDSLDANNHLFEFYKPSYSDKINDGYNNPDKNWIGDFRIPMVIIYNKQTVSEEDVPLSWNDLLNPKFNGEIAMGDPAYSGSTYTQLVTLLTIMGRNKTAWDFIEQLTQNMNGNTFQHSLDIPKKVNSGEYMLGITLESYAYEQFNQNGNIGFIYPVEGTTARASGIALFKNSPNLQNAHTFIDFVLNPATEEAVANNFYRRPTHVDIISPKTLKKYEDIKIIDYDYQWATDHMDYNLEKWKELITKAENTCGDEDK